jgi:hypothetical protein
MLEGVEAQIRQTRGIRVTVDPEDPAFIVKFIRSYFQISPYQAFASTSSGRLLRQTAGKRHCVNLFSSDCTLSLLRIGKAFNSKDSLSGIPKTYRLRYHCFDHRLTADFPGSGNQKNIAAPHEAKSFAKLENQIVEMRVVSCSLCRDLWKRVPNWSNERRGGEVWQH